MRLLKKSILTLSTITSILLTGCGSGGNTLSVTGVLADGAIGNASYKCGTTTGFTNVKGEFTCPVGSSVDFFYGNIKLGGVTKLPSDKIVLIQDVLHVSREKVNDESVTRMAVFLQSLDKNSNHDDGIFLDPSYITDSITTAVDFSQFDDKKVTELIQKAKKTEVTKEIARTNLYEVTQNVKLYKNIDGKTKPPVSTPSSGGSTSPGGSSTPDTPPKCGYTLNGIYFNGIKISSSNYLGLGSTNNLTLNFSVAVNTTGLTVTSTDGNVTLGTITKSGDNNISFDYTASSDMMHGKTSDLNITDTLSIKQGLCSNTADVKLYKKYVAPITRAELDTLITNYTNAYDINQTATDTLAYAQDIVNADTSNITDMGRLFISKSTFNLDISAWDTSNVETMTQMFYGTAFNQDISDWNTSKVTSMSYMFNTATAFDQNIGSWDTSKVETMKNMFAGANSFNQALDFNTSSVINMSVMFQGASSFNQALNFDTSSVTNMNNMFKGATAFNQPLNFNTSNVRSMSFMFDGATAFNKTLTFSDTSSVVTMSAMFARTSAFNQPLNFDTSSVTALSTMFHTATAFNQPLNFNTSSVTNISYMFNGATAFNETLTFSDTSKVTNMSNMFEGATAFNQALNFDTSSVLNMGAMFKGAIGFNQDISSWNTSSVVNMSYMFLGATAFNQNLSAWDVSNFTSHTDFETNAGFTDWANQKPDASW